MFDPISFDAHWKIDGCPSSTVNLKATAEIDGTTYNPNTYPPFLLFPDGWGLIFEYNDVSLDLASSFHTLTIVIFSPLNYITESLDMGSECDRWRIYCIGNSTCVCHFDSLLI